MRNWTAHTNVDTIQTGKFCWQESVSVVVENRNGRIQMAPEVLHDLSNEEQLPPAKRPTVLCTRGQADSGCSITYLQSFYPSCCNDTCKKHLVSWEESQPWCGWGKEAAWLSSLAGDLQHWHHCVSFTILFICLPSQTEVQHLQVHKPVEGENPKPNLLLVPPKLRWRMLWSCLHAAWRYCHNHKSWGINSWTLDSVEVVYKSHAGSQERGKFQPVKFMAQQAVEDLVSSCVMYLSPPIILLPWTSVETWRCREPRGCSACLTTFSP